MGGAGVEASVTRCTLLAFTSDFGIGWGHESRNLCGTPSVLGVLRGATNRCTGLERTGEMRVNVRDLEITGMWMGWDEITQGENLDKRSQGPTLRHPVFTGWVDQPSSETKKESRKAEAHHPEECGVAPRRFPPGIGSAGMCRMCRMRVETWPVKGQRGAGCGDSVQQWGQGGKRAPTARQHEVLDLMLLTPLQETHDFYPPLQLGKLRSRSQVT